MQDHKPIACLHLQDQIPQETMDMHIMTLNVLESPQPTGRAETGLQVGIS